MKPHKILIVDDEPSILLALESLLNAKGYSTQKASDGKEGLTVAKRFRPDLILLDVMMPNMDGHEFASTIRKSKKLLDTKIIFITAKGETSDKMKGYLTGGDDYIIKPFSTEKILERITFLLEN